LLARFLTIPESPAKITRTSLATGHGEPARTKLPNEKQTLSVFDANAKLRVWLAQSNETSLLGRVPAGNNSTG
jgi:hypothetical protein